MTNGDSNSSLTRRNLVKGAALGAVATGLGMAATKEAAAQQAYDAIVIGTGFGGTIATLALHAQNKKILVIERGTFWITPETLGSPPKPALDPSGKPVPPLAKWASDHNYLTQYWSRPDHGAGLVDLLSNRYHEGNRKGLHNYRMFRQAHILTASGVGGGSLIYSNVNLRAQPDVLDRIGLKSLDYGRAERFMEKYRGKMHAVVTKIPLPANLTPDKLGDKDYLLLDRSRALRDAAAVASAQLGISMTWSPLKLSVVEYDDAANTEADAQHTFCERQGRCILGCLPQARHTLNKTLYKFVFSKDAQTTLSPQSEVRTIKKVGDTYEVTYLDHRNDPFPQATTVRAPQIFLAAGVLGTTEILLRSRNQTGLRLSDKLGSGFSTNGDFGALAVGTKRPDGSKMTVSPTRGPINTADVSFDTGGKHYTVEDCGIPAMFARIARMGIDHPTLLRGLEFDLGFLNTTPQSPLKKDPNQTEAEMIDDVFFFNAMGEDDASGRFTLDGDKLDLDWDHPIADHPVFAKHEEIMRSLSQAMGGTYRALPTWDGLPFIFDKKTLIVTHPLGGCRIGQTMNEGVVNEFGQVYDESKKATDPNAVHSGLYIVDGSVIPGALAANPTLTISAQALKAVEKAVGPLPNI